MELIDKYNFIFEGKEKLTDNETNIWFDFINECSASPMFTKIALLRKCEIINPNNYRYILVPSYDNNIVFGYLNNGNNTNWNKVLHSIDTKDRAIVIKDKTNNTYFKVPIDFISTNYIITILANLRSVTKKNAKFDTDNIY